MNLVPGPLYEAGNWTYSLYVPQDTRSLVEIAGGKADFKKRLDLFFSPVFTANSPHARYRYDVGNEPSFLCTYLYNWIGEQSSTAKTIRVALLLSEPGRDFTGREFVLTEQRPRMQSRPEVVPLRLGDAVAFAVHHRLFRRREELIA
jgi:hypothetical protein